MLKKKEWLRKFKTLLTASGELSLYSIQECIKYADEGWKKQLSPGEAANEIIEFTEDFLYANKSGS